MPVGPGEYADVLRALGRLLDAEFAMAVEVVVGPDGWDVSWRKKGLGSDRRHFEESAVYGLRSFAGQSRGTYKEQPGGGLAEQLRTLGQELDEEGRVLARIVQEPDGLLVTTSRGADVAERKYLDEELAAASQRRREGRPGASGEAPSRLTVRRPVNPAKIPTPPRAEGWGHDDDRGPLSRRLGK